MNPGDPLLRGPAASGGPLPSGRRAAVRRVEIDAEDVREIAGAAEEIPFRRVAGLAGEPRDELPGVLQPCDRLVVSELSRLGRSLGQIVTILAALAKAGVAFVALK